MSRVITFVRRIAGLLEPSLESEFYEEFTKLSKYLDELIVVSDRADAQISEFKVYRAKTIKIPKIYGLTKIISYCWAIFKFRKSVDVIYLRTFSPPESIASWFGKKLLRKRLIVLIPGTWLFEPNTPKNRMFRWIFSRTVYASDVVILYSQRMLSSILNYFPKLEKRKIIYLHNAVNVNRFKPGKPDEEVLERYVSGGNDRKMLLYVGRISARKGILDLVKAYSIIHEKYPNTILLMAGGKDERYAQKVEKLIRKLDLEKHVILLGPIPNKDIVELMKACEVFLYASIGGEGIPRAILEAMACGKPVVATDVAGVAEAVRDNETGFLVKVRDYKTLAEKALKILNDESLKETLGDNARRLIEDEFSYDSVIPKLAEILSGKEVSEHEGFDGWEE